MGKNSDIIQFDKVKDFNPEHIFDCGQCFRWEPVDEEEPQGAWQGIAGDRAATIEYDSDKEVLTIYPGRKEDREFWRKYFDLDRDYGVIKQRLSENDPVMTKAIEAGGGIRILNQDRWETLVSFIISQNNNIPRIKKCINSLAEVLGEPIGKASDDDKTIYALPAPEVLARATEEDLAPCRLGYRAGYLIEAAGQVVEETADMEALADEDISAEDAAESLRGFCGVGPKVANCVALFCLGKVDCFPLDVWMKRVMNKLYGIPEKDVGAMAEYAREHFSPYGGIAQQYLFYYITHNFTGDE
ncbi:MAG: DNA-3-methyladenine glycosylase family protein [Lentihominibacter sp.]|jgi:N-glycosylase/DNA lyase